MTRKPPKGKSLAEVNPELAKEWHPTKNGSLKAYDFLPNSHKKVWWKCGKEEDHEYESIISSRFIGSGCPICDGKKVIFSNCLATLNPDLAKEWHPTKNADLTPFDVTLVSGKKVWWKCEYGEDHEWESTVANRVKGNGCAVCKNKKIVNSNCLATLNPGLAKEWHPTKNADLTPFDVGLGSHKKVWWQCDKGDDHEWIAKPGTRSKGVGCSVCANQKVVFSNCLATLNPDLAKEWHPTKNGDLTPFEVTPVSGKKVWWKCEHGEDHEWESTVANRAKGDRCTVCKNKKIVNSNCLATLNPGLAKEWHSTKNGDLTPFDVGLGSHKKVWWQCDKGDDHQWQSIVVSRSNGRGCPVCIGQKVVLSNCLATLNPDLAKEWHSTKNGSLTPFDVTIGTPKKAWWSCKKDDNHIWHTTISNRSRKIGGNCPYCTLTPQSKQELTITFELIQFFKINPKGFKLRVQGKLWTIDIYIPELNLGIEFDGSYWHKGKRELDKLKTEKLQDDGFKIMRIREEPLKIITDIDVISKTPFNAKVVTNDILTHIMESYSLESKRIKKIEKYLLKKDIQNEKGLDAYIEMILTEKAENKNS